MVDGIIPGRILVAFAIGRTFNGISGLAVEGIVTDGVPSILEDVQQNFGLYDLTCPTSTGL